MEEEEERLRTSPFPSLLHINLVLQQSTAGFPPEHPLVPPYNPGNFPPFTKSKSTGKKTLYPKETLFALDKSTVSFLPISKTSEKLRRKQY